MKKQSVKEWSFFRRSPAMVAALAVAGFACAPSVPLQNRPCPCADGWVCCPSGNVCAHEANSCPGAGGPAGTGGATSGGTAGVAGGTAGNGGATSGGAAGAAMQPDAGLPTLPDPTYMVQPTLLGTWSGYFENFTFPSKSDGIRLSLSQNADGSGKISVVLGTGSPPPPPTSASDTWPPTTPNKAGSFIGLDASYIEGFAYDAYDVHWDGERVKFVINGDEPWQPYCQLQTSHYETKSVSPPAYECSPADSEGVGNADGSITCYADESLPNPRVVSCMQVFACDSLCACNATGCGSRINTTAFDITFTGTKGQGNVTIDNGHDVMLTQVGTPDGGQP